MRTVTAIQLLNMVSANTAMTIAEYYRVEVDENSPSGYIRSMKTTLTEPEIVMHNGKPVSVILPIKDYEELMERVEDATDVAWLKRARRQPLQYRPLAEYLAERECKARV
jgi:prevent-host-death family protein